MVKSQYISIDANDTWVKLGQTIEGEDNDDQLGNTVQSIRLNSNGTILAVGAYGADGENNSKSSCGEVSVYQYQDSDGDGVNDTWVRIGQILEGEDNGDRLGGTISLDYTGTILAVGARNADGENNSKNACGEVTVYQYQDDSNTWVQIGQTLEGQDALDQIGAEHGVSLSPDGNTLAVGAIYADGENNSKSNCGEVSVYQYQDTNDDGINDTWVLIAPIIEGSSLDNYTSYVSLSSNQM